MVDASIIIPCYNQGEFLKDSVGSALAQTFKDCEVMVVDDGSDDEKTKAAISKLPPQVRVLWTENRGLPAARNHGIAAAAGEFICCLDADDMLHRDYIGRTVAALKGDASVEYGIVTTGVRNFGVETGSWRILGFDPVRLLLGNCLHVASLFRKRCWEEVGGYDETLAGYQDWEFWISIVEKGYKWACIEDELFLRRCRAGSMLSCSDTMRDKLMTQIVTKHLDFYSRHMVSIMVEADRANRQMAAELSVLKRTRAVRLADILAKSVSSWRGLLLAPFRIAKLCVPDLLKDKVKARADRTAR